MFYLTNTTHSVSLVTDVVGSLDVTTSYVDITNSASGPLSNTVSVTGSGTTSIIAAPAASTTRQIKSIIIRNASTTVSSSISVTKVVSATPYTLTPKVTLTPGMYLTFEDGVGWVTLKRGGAELIKTANLNMPTGSIITNSVGVLTAATQLKLDVQDKNLLLASVGISSPAAPGASTLKIFNRSLATRGMLAQVGPSGLDTAFQPLLARNKIGFWCPPGEAVTVPGVLGFTAYTATGTPTLRNVATTNMFTRLRRLGYVSVATAGGLAGPRVAVAQVTLGDYALSMPVGGFLKVIRFGTSDAATVAGARMFVGVSATTTAPTNVEPTTLLNSIGVTQLSTSSNLQVIASGAVAQPAIDLGVDFPANTLSEDVYELSLFSPAGRGGIVYYQVTRLNTGHIAEGTLSITTTMGQLPLSSILLTYTQAWRCNNATALSVGLDVFSDYIETDQ